MNTGRNVKRELDANWMTYCYHVDYIHLRYSKEKQDMILGGQNLTNRQWENGPFYQSILPGPKQVKWFLDNIMEKVNLVFYFFAKTALYW